MLPDFTRGSPGRLENLKSDRIEPNEQFVRLGRERFQEGFKNDLLL